ncbi:MAG: hypothetical protein A2161_04065 [Candidatus Schekmanbacteria bacterium RBG_13_48_7]|uniref:Thiamine-binding protein domain-containing protein n=1 Tax=Candidatus Schekmanbacteria bacterium RBG_13_48_7 TaxID=1817878 RepID=A0A1F7RM00_9BACT|nr:MAG: hypothetical protein A2161_04065 [Candidatus Schekmanbacteria bacterium RBG_13_48_7]
MLAEFSISPLDKGESLSAYVSKSLEIVVNSGLPYRLTAMGTIVEGEPEEVFDLIIKCHMNMRSLSNRVSTLIKIDDRKGKTNRLEGKIQSVEQKLGINLKK